MFVDVDLEGDFMLARASHRVVNGVVRSDTGEFMTNGHATPEAAVEAAIAAIRGRPPRRRRTDDHP